MLYYHITRAMLEQEVRNRFTSFAVGIAETLHTNAEHRTLAACDIIFLHEDNWFNSFMWDGFDSHLLWYRKKGSTSNKL